MYLFRQIILFLIIQGLIILIKAIPKPQEWVVNNYIQQGNLVNNANGIPPQPGYYGVNNNRRNIIRGGPGYYSKPPPPCFNCRINNDPTVVVVGGSAIAEREAARREYAARMEEYDPEKEL